MVKAASESIKTVSTNFKLAKLLEIILNIGNFLNYGTYAGNAFGYGIDSLLKLRDTKSTKQNDYTVLHYLAQYITENRFFFFFFFALAPLASFSYSLGRNCWVLLMIWRLSLRVTPISLPILTVCNLS